MSRELRSLAHAATSIVQDPEWLECSARAFAPPHRVRTVAVDGAVALLVRGGPTTPWSEVPGAKQLGEPVDVLAEDAAAAEALAEEFIRCDIPLVMRRTWLAAPIVAALERTSARRAALIRSAAPGTPYLELDGLPEPEAALNSRRRSDLRRAYRRAAAIGPVRFEVLSPGEAESRALLDRALRVEAQSWKGPAGTALVHDRRRAGFYRDYARAAGAAGVLRVAFAWIGDEPAAMQVAVERHGALWLLKIGYDDRFARASPGQLLLAHTLGWAIEHKLERLELLGNEEPWTRAWTRVSRPHVRLGLFPRGPRGIAAGAVGAVSVGGRRLLASARRP